VGQRWLSISPYTSTSPRRGHSLTRPSRGIGMCSLKMQVRGALLGSVAFGLHKLTGLLTHPLRGEAWCRSHRPHLHGRDGLWNGLLLSAVDLPVLQYRGRASYV